jgi:predicted enzyme related to lactoylglutathione lyase
MSPRVSFSFTKLRVGDLAGLAKFYTSVCGFAEKARIEVEHGLDGNPVSEVVLGTGEGGADLVLISYHGTQPQPQTEAELGMTTDDLDDFLKRARSAGAKIIMDPVNAEHGEIRFRAALLTDPEGHMIEAVQYLP